MTTTSGSTNSKLFLHSLDAKNIERKLKLASDLFQMAFDVKCFQLKNKHPELSDHAIKHRAYALIEKGCR